jgi:hypothetical protein
MHRLMALGLLIWLGTGCTAIALRTPHPAPMGAISGGTLGVGEIEGSLGGAFGSGCDRVDSTRRSGCTRQTVDGAFTGAIELGVGPGVSVVAIQGMVRAGYSSSPITLNYRGGVRHRGPIRLRDAPAERGATGVLGIGGSFGSGGLVGFWPTVGLDVEVGWAMTGSFARPRMGIRLAVQAPVEPLWGGWSSGPWLYVLPEIGVGLSMPKTRFSADVGLSAWLGVNLERGDWVAIGLEVSGHWIGRSSPRGRGDDEEDEDDLDIEDYEGEGEFEGPPGLDRPTI